MNLKEPKSIWQVPIYLPYLQPTLTNDMLKEAQAEIGYKLPTEYVELLKLQNGGYIRYTLADTPHSQISGIGPYFPSITEFDWLAEYEGAVSFELSGLIPFDGDGHWNICLDYRRNKNEPEVTYIDTESDYERKIATSFKEYLGLLFIKTEGEYGIETSRSLKKTVKQISNVTGLVFGEIDTLSQGYPIYSGKFNEVWVWVSPNKVPTGFIRPDEERYGELEHWMKSSSLRYPELSENNLLISTSNESDAQHLFKKLNDEGLGITGLSDLLNKSPNR